MWCMSQSTRREVSLRGAPLLSPVTPPFAATKQSRRLQSAHLIHRFARSLMVRHIIPHRCPAAYGGTNPSLRHILSRRAPDQHRCPTAMTHRFRPPRLPRRLPTHTITARKSFPSIKRGGSSPPHQRHSRLRATSRLDSAPVAFPAGSRRGVSSPYDLHLAHPKIDGATHLSSWERDRG